MQYSVVVPVYNEKENIEALYERIRTVLCGMSESYETIFIDDGSNDGTYELLKRIGLADPKVRILSFDRNYGQHPAVIAGFEHARGNLIITLDADLQNPPEEIPKVAAAVCDSYDMIAGRRTGRQDSALRVTGSFLANLFMFLLTRVRLKDYGTMLRVIKRDLAMKIAAGYRSERLYITVLASKISPRVMEVDVAHNARLAGRSKYDLKKLIQTFFFMAVRYYGWTARLAHRVGIIRDEAVLYRIERRVEKGIEKTVTDAAVRVVAASGDGAEGGLLLVKDDYDSAYFGKRIGRLVCCGAPVPAKDCDALIEAVLDAAGQLVYDYIYFTVDQARKGIFESTGAGPFIPCGSSLDFCLQLRNAAETNRPAAGGLEVRPAVAGDEPRIRNIAASAFRRSRLYGMGFSSEAQIDAYHSAWAANLLKDKSTRVYVAAGADGVFGFLGAVVDMDKRTSRIVLIAVAPNSRGRGFGGLLVERLIDDLGGTVDRLYAKTQENNTVAARFYRGLGFEVAGREYGYQYPN